MSRIVVAGEALIDLIVAADGRLSAIPGGGPYNTARTIARLGGDVAFLGRLSSDRFGRTLRAALAADGVRLDLVSATDDPTTLAVAELDAHGTASYRFYVDGTSAPGLSQGDAATIPRHASRRPGQSRSQAQEDRKDTDHAQAVVEGQPRRLG